MKETKNTQGREKNALYRRISKDLSPEPQDGNGSKETEHGDAFKNLNYIRVYFKSGRRPVNSPLRNFFLIVYLLYYRYTVEFGISVMTFAEAAVVNTLAVLIIFSSINQGSRLIFYSCKWLIRLARVMIWAFRHMDKINV